jgi:hypothetical protein
MTTIQVDITLASTGALEWTMPFPSVDAANEWIALCENTNTWGKPQRVLIANEQGEVVDVDGSLPDLTKAIATGTIVDINGVTVNTYTMPADYTITQTDITAQVEAEEAIAQGLKCQEAGAKCVAKVYAINSAKFATGVLTRDQFLTMASDPTLALIERFLWGGALGTAKTLLSAYVGTDFTTEDINQIIAIIDESGLV